MCNNSPIPELWRALRAPEKRDTALKEALASRHNVSPLPLHPISGRAGCDSRHMRRVAGSPILCDR